MHVQITLRRWVCCGLVLCGLALADAAWGQETPKGTIPKPKAVSVETKDGIELWGVYYASNRGKEAKESVPVLLLHDWGGSGADFKALAEFLQREGMAVLVPDLRGHGESTKRKGSDKELDHKKMPVSQCQLMYKLDVEAWKNDFFIKQNNQEKLNIEKLCVVGAGLGGIVAMNWAVIDWSWPPVAGQQQGQDVKALVLLSPPWTEKSVSVNNLFKFPVIAKELTIYIVVGKKGTVAADAGKIHKKLETARDGTGDEKNLFFQSIETNRQGVELLAIPNFKLADNIRQFIKVKLEDKPIEWKPRKSPLE